MSIQISIDSVSEQNNEVFAVIRNTGTTSLPADYLMTYVDGKPIDTTGCNTEIKPSERCSLKLLGVAFPQKGVTIEISIIPKNGDLSIKYSCTGTGSNYC